MSKNKVFDRFYRIDYSTKLEDLRRACDDALNNKDGWTDCRLVAEFGDSCYEGEFAIVGWRDETDKEYERRLKDEAKFKAKTKAEKKAKKEAERKLYESLKKKFEKSK